MRHDDELVTILVVDDEERFRLVVGALLATEDDFAVVGEATGGQEAVEKAGALLPDLVLLDVRMPGVSGLEAARTIQQELPATKVVMLTASDEEDDVFEALRAGASAYLLKDALLEDLPGILRAVSRGLGLLLSPAIAKKLVAEFKDNRHALPATTLTAREIEVLRLVSQGRANHEIAAELNLSSHTVKRHVANILAKLHQRSRLDAVMQAIREGVLAS